jgi:hypothetical protein
MTPDWLFPTLALLPATLWLFLGVGLPWALAVLPRSDWRPVQVIAVSMALGPALTTTAMFVIGTVGRFSAATVISASILIAATGLVLAVRNRTPRTAIPPQPDAPTPPLTMIDWALVAVIGVAVLLRTWNTAYWPFATYDEFWVYGYNARVFMLQGAIPTTMGYYPQLVPLSFTYAQVLWGGINDHAARTVVPLFGLASVLMTYLLGRVAFNRRAGLLAAAIWALYPQHGVWSQFGDLEVPLTLYFTGTAAYFIATHRRNAARYAILSGLMLGAALWTKPTAGALVQSLGLVVLAVGAWWFARRRAGGGEPDADRPPPVRSAVLALLPLVVAVPMGGMWYVRNVLLGHPPLVFPAGYWQLEAQRSGQELGWPLLIGIALAIGLIVRRERPWWALFGAGLLAAGVVTSAVGWQIPSVEQLSAMLVGQIVFVFRPPDLGSPPDPGHLLRVGLAWGAILIGAASVGWAALPTWRRMAAGRRGVWLALIAFVLPYGVTWFWSYSYHFRLSFAIVPLLIVMLAGVISRLALSPAPLRGRAVRLVASSVRVALVVLIVALALPGWVATLSALPHALHGTLPDADSRMAFGNPALMDLVAFLRARQADLGRPLRLIAPGELRLGFFFPDSDIRGDLYPTTLDEVADVDYFIDSSPGQRLYAYHGKLYNQVLRSVTRTNAMRRDFTTDDGNFRFSVYTILNQQRFAKTTPTGPIGAQFGEYVVLEGYDLGLAYGKPGDGTFLTLHFRALKPTPVEYSLFIHLWDAKRQRLIAQWSGQPMDSAYFVWYQVPGEHIDVAYPTTLWQPGEMILDDRRLTLPEDVPPGDYELRVGLYDPISGERLPILENGLPDGDSAWIYRFQVQPR